MRRIKMKIEKLVLKNFSAVKNALKANEITIDFNQAINNICLIIGPNGSGKTTILSMLHPFADLGNLDVRNNNNLILDKKDGYKEITIRKNDNLYTIKHFYTYKTSKDRKYHSVKSYIAKNGQELNPNGNVSSFKELVKDELQIEQDYLKLIRLGSNVTSLIDLSSTERKNFMSKIMDDIGIYLTYYKSINIKLRQLDEMISHNIDKLNKLKIADKEEYQESIQTLKERIEINQSEYIKMSNDLAISKKQYNDIDDVENLHDNIKSTKSKLKKMANVLARQDEMESTEPSFYDDKISKDKEQLIQNNAIYDSNVNTINNELRLLDTLDTQLHSLQVQDAKDKESHKELARMEENLTKTRKKLREYESTLGDFKPTINKDDLESFVKFLNNENKYLDNMYSFGKPVIKQVIELVENNKNVMKYISSHLMSIDNSQDKNDLFLSNLSRNYFKNNYDKKIDCDKDCPAKSLFYHIENLLRDNMTKDNDKDISFYENMQYVYDNLRTILNDIKEYEDTIKLLPDYHKDYFRANTLFSHLKNLEPIYDEKRLLDLLSITTEYDNYVKLTEEYHKEENIKDKFSSLSTKSSLEDQIKSVQSVIIETRDNLIKLRDDNKLIKEKNKALENDIETYSDIKESLTSYTDTFNKYQKYQEDEVKLKSILNTINEISIKLDRSNDDLQTQRKSLQTMISNLHQYESIEKEMESMNNAYDDLTLIKKSLSSKEGMPLRIIGRYLDNTEDITNELLDIAYDGKIYIDKFNITANEFSIPFYNNGVRLDDVKYASQGELSFLSIALSFALSSQVLSKYNIMLLDEIDGPLDTRNREKFIKILENQIERIHSEQNFLITHNDMFSSYPVDILDLSFKNDTEEYSLANFIQIERK